MLTNAIKNVGNSIKFNFKSCGQNCKCTNRMNIVTSKVPLNIIDEAIIILKIRELKKEYQDCFNNKSN